jgi:SNF2 family DNA or RNA helicase
MTPNVYFIYRTDSSALYRNYSQVLVLLLRLRQICSHPSLIQEGGAAFISAEEADGDDAAPGSSRELARARQLVSPEFVTKMKAKFKAAALQRIAAEKEVSLYTLQVDY